MSQSLREQIVQSYFRTTAESGHSASRDYYDFAADGLVRWLRPWLPEDKSAQCLDLASGCGELLYFLEREGFHNTAGVDLCEQELDSARQHINAQLHHAAIIDHLQQTKSASVDLLTALNILEHLNKDELLAVLTEAKRVLKPSGMLIAQVPNAISPFGSATRYWDMTHEWAFTPGNFRQLARLIGFSERIDFRECGPEPHGFLSSIRYVLWQGLRMAITLWMLIEVGNSRERVYTMNMFVRLHALSS
jgi:ubiquinone/menaquinone biosynthesis C-methylase UbiE